MRAIWRTKSGRTASGRLQQPQSGTVEQVRHKPLGSIQLTEHGGYVVAVQHDRQPARLTRPNDIVRRVYSKTENLAVQE
jgi:hypothetical protein